MLTRVGAAAAATAALFTLSAPTAATATPDPTPPPPPPPACASMECTGTVESYDGPPAPAKEEGNGSGQGSQQPTRAGGSGGPDAQVGVGVSAPAGPSAPVDQCEVLECVSVDLGIFGPGDDVTLVPNADPAAPAAAAPAPAAGQPRARAARPDPVAVARRSVANLSLKTVTPGSTPLEPGSISIVGIPTWMWAENANALGTVTDTASVPGLSLTMTAKLSGVTWDMGDGTVIECEGTGTKWSPDLGTGDSPTCGHTYTTQGTRTVTSTAHWSVTWRASTGQTGVIDRDLASTSTIRVGEVQVINSKKGDS